MYNAIYFYATASGGSSTQNSILDVRNYSKKNAVSLKYMYTYYLPDSPIKIELITSQSCFWVYPR